MLHNSSFTRRDLLRYLVYGGASVGWLAAGSGIGHIVPPLLEQYITWQEAACDAATFTRKYAKKLSCIQFGANLCPDYKLMPSEADPVRTVKLLKDYFGCTHVRLGMRWRTHAEQGLAAYDRWIEALFKNEVKTILAYGVKSPFPPETHFPQPIEQNLKSLGVRQDNSILARLSDAALSFTHWSLGVRPGSTVHAGSPLGALALAYTHELLDHLDSEFGLDNFYGFNPENESDAHYGVLGVGVGEDLLRAHAQRLYHPQRSRRMLINTNLISPLGRPASISMAVKNAIAFSHQFPTLAMIVGADIYEESAAGRISPNIYVDTFAGVRLRHGDDLIPKSKALLNKAKIQLEVTEFQISDWIKEPRRHEPGSRIHTQYLLARIADYLVDEQLAPPNEPMIVRLWEMGTILFNLLQDEQFFYTNDTFPLIQTINRRL